MLTIAERALTADERREIEARHAQARFAATSTYTRTFAAAAIVGGALCAVTLGVSDAPRIVIVAFWGALTAILTVWIAHGHARDARRQAAILGAALAHGRARETRIASRRVVELEEIEDEGACYAFQIDEDRILFVLGQEFYADDSFPNEDFSLVEILLSAGNAADVLLVKHGGRLEPERRIVAAVKDVLLVPDHLEVIDGDVRHLERVLSPIPRRAGA